MELKCIKYPKIPSFDAAVINVKRAVTYAGRDENNKPIWDNTRVMPTIKLKGTIKLHGTNASIVYDNIHGLRVQSREHIITSNKKPQKGVMGDNAGFCKNVEDNIDAYKKIIGIYVKKYDIDLDNNSLCIYGEWAGKGIHSKVAITQLEKSFYCFNVRVKPITNEVFNDSTDEEFRLPSTWLSIDLVKDEGNRIYNMDMFKQYETVVDFSDGLKSIEYFNKLVDEVESECPIAKHFGVEGIGEGVVFKGMYDGRLIMFKIKGQKHTKSNIKTLITVDPVKMKSIDDFVDNFVTKERVMKGIENGIVGEAPTIKHTSNVLKWVMRDVITEESHTLEASGLTSKEVSKRMVHKIKLYFQEYLREVAFG